MYAVCLYCGFSHMCVVVVVVHVCGSACASVRDIFSTITARTTTHSHTETARTRQACTLKLPSKLCIFNGHFLNSVTSILFGAAIAEYGCVLTCLADLVCCLQHAHHFHRCISILETNEMNSCEFKKFNCFCYVCGRRLVMPSRRKITPEVADAYGKYFNLPIEFNVEWAPSIICTTCLSRLNRWIKGEVESMMFGVPMIWSDPIIHMPDHCYACVNYSKGRTQKDGRKVVYSATRNARLPVPHSDSVPIPNRPSPTEEYIPPTFDTVPESTFSAYEPSNITKACEHIEITPERLDRITRRLKLSGRKSILLAQELKAVNILAPNVNIFSARGRHKHYTAHFKSIENNSLAYCTDIRALVSDMQNVYDPEEWRLFIDSSKSSLKAVLLHIENAKNSIPIALSTNTKENYASLKKIIELVKYEEHQWKICADLKVITLLRGMQTGYTKNMCFMCLWDTRFAGNQYDERNWPMREEIRLRRNNVIEIPLVPVEKILLPPLHIKLGIVKNFIKRLNPLGNAFNELHRIFPRLSAAKIKEGKYGYKIEYLEWV